MKKVIAVHGLVGGAIVAAGMLASMAAGLHSVVIGYLTMLVALTMVFVGIKRYRDEYLGGAIRFPVALAVGLGIATVASAIYVLAWEAWLYATDYSFMADFSASAIASARENGAGAAEIARMQAEFAGFAESYRDPMFRMVMTLMEIAPVAVIVSLVSALLLRRPGFLPARSGRRSVEAA